MASFFIPLSGLDSNTTALDTIANDLANLNTTGFKTQTVNFSDLFYQQVGETGSGDLLQVGGGVQTSSIESDFAAGTPTATGNASDVALTGNGLFVLNDGGTNLYTRDGNFVVATNGNLESQSGLQVMGYPAANGVVNPNAPLTGINIPLDTVQAAKATANFGITANLDSSAAVGATATSQFQVYDSLGTAQQMTVTYTKTANNSWNYSIALPAGAASGSANTTGTLTFDTSGNLTSPAANVAGVSFTGLTDGAAGMTLNWNILGSAGKPTITQTDAASASPATTQDGYTSGEYQGYAIGNDGTITATFSNGNNVAVGQIALGNVANLQGLQLMGNGDYAATTASGVASIGVSGTGGLGAMDDDNLEASNVNISAEFSNLIIAQRAFEADSKAVTTFDSVVQDTINMVH
jgi:flagellar hook protein FlgE